MKFKYDSMSAIPPIPFRTRVVDGGFWAENEPLIKSTFETAQSLLGNSNENIRIANEWAGCLIDLGNKGKLARSSEPLSVLAELGIVLAVTENRLLATGQNNAEYLIHSCLAIMSMNENKSQHILNSLALDGGFYLQKSGTSVEALGESIETYL
jgi:hypothetical protein